MYYAYTEHLGLVLLSVCRTQQAQYSSKTGISYLKKALAFINENYSTDITSKSIAEAAGVSQSYLNKLFRNDFNLSINEYLNKLRVERAKKLMEQTNLSLGEIYPIIGIRTKQNFNKHFFRYNKVSPQELKSQPNPKPALPTLTVMTTSAYPTMSITLSSTVPLRLMSKWISMLIYPEFFSVF